MSCEVVSSYIFCSLQTRFHPDDSALLFQFSALRDQINWINNLLSLSGGLQFFFFHLTDSFFGEGETQAKGFAGRKKQNILFKFLVKGAGNLSIANVWVFFLH